MAMKISIGSDHAGFEQKQELAAYLKEQGFEVIDRGPDSDDRVDYPDYAAAVAHDVSNGVADRGASIRVPHSFVNNGYKGYLEDRRPNSMGDPYQIASQVLKTISEVPTAKAAAAA